MKGIRQEIHYNGYEFKKILNSESFKEYFGEIEGEKLKPAPKEYPKDQPDIELLKYKSFLAIHKCPDELVQSESFLEHSTKAFEALYPFDQFLNRVVD